jgi:hypothetical protein
MNKESETVADCEAQDHEECQDRRQFCNGLGKWSLAIIAAVSSLGMSGRRVQAAHEAELRPEPEPQRPAWAAPGDRNQRMAGHFRSRHKNVHNNSTEYLKYAHGNSHQNSGIQ